MIQLCGTCATGQIAPGSPQARVVRSGGGTKPRGNGTMVRRAEKTTCRDFTSLASKVHFSCCRFFAGKQVAMLEGIWNILGSGGFMGHPFRSVLDSRT